MGCCSDNIRKGYPNEGSKNAYKSKLKSKRNNNPVNKGRYKKPMSK